MYFWVQNLKEKVNLLAVQEYAIHQHIAMLYSIVIVGFATNQQFMDVARLTKNYKDKPQHLLDSNKNTKT